MEKYFNDYPMLCNDVIFKSLFENCKFALERFIYDITGDKVQDVELCFNEIPIVRGKEKFKRCDFLIKDNNTIYNIELNNNYYDTLIIKNTSYIFSLYSTDASRGEEYNKDLKVVQININNYTRFDKPFLDYRIMNDNYYYVYLDSLKIYDLDIVKCNKLYYNDRTRRRRYLKWGALFSCTDINDMNPILDELLSKKESLIVMEKLYKITKEDYIMSEAEALRLDDMFRKSIQNEGKKMGIEEGKCIGIEKNMQDMIKAMLDNKASYEFISKVSGKSVEEIIKIENNLYKSSN